MNPITNQCSIKLFLKKKNKKIKNNKIHSITLKKSLQFKHHRIHIQIIVIIITSYRLPLLHPMSEPSSFISFLPSPSHPSPCVTLPVNINTILSDSLHLSLHAIVLTLAWRGDPVHAATRAAQIDPQAVLPRIISIGIQMLSMEVCSQDPEMLNAVDAAEDLTQSEHEELHVLALRSLVSGDMSNAAARYRHIIRRWPRDILAIKFAHDLFLLLGDALSLRDTLSSVVPEWARDKDGLKVQGEWDYNLDTSHEEEDQHYVMDLYGILLGMHAFGLNETNLLSLAREEACEAIARNPNDGWAHHALAHVLESEGKAEEGICRLQSQEDDWKNCSLLASHIYWHVALFWIEKGETRTAEEIYHNHIFQFINHHETKKDTEPQEQHKKHHHHHHHLQHRSIPSPPREHPSTSPSPPDLIDASSLLLRLELQDHPVADTTWDRLAETMVSRSTLMHRRVTMFGDVHLMMALSRSPKYRHYADRVLFSIDLFAKDMGHSIQQQTRREEYGRPMAVVFTGGPFERIEEDELQLQHWRHSWRRRHRNYGRSEGIAGEKRGEERRSQELGNENDSNDRYFAMHPEEYNDQQDIAAEIGLKLCRAIALYQMGEDYHSAAEVLFSVRSSLPRLGGSFAQRDVFHQMFLESAIKCAELYSGDMKDMAQSVINERKMIMPNQKSRGIDARWVNRLNLLKEK